MYVPVSRSSRCTVFITCHSKKEETVGDKLHTSCCLTPHSFVRSKTPRRSTDFNEQALMSDKGAYLHSG